MSRGQRVIIAKKSKQHTGGFILKKNPKRNIKEAQHHAVDVMLGFSRKLTLGLSQSAAAHP